MKVARAVMTGIRWIFNTRQWEPAGSDWVHAAQCVQSEEKKRIGQFVYKRDAKSSMIGRLMLRKMLHRLTKIPYADIKLGRTEKGKPYLINSLPQSRLSFNVSHHGDYVVLAAETETDVEVGIDVMKLEAPVASKSVSEFFHTMRRQFTEDEWVCIKSGDTETSQLATFYRLWCLKESYVKALGIGIGFEVKRLNFSLSDDLPSDGDVLGSTSLQVDDRPTPEWMFQETRLDNHCIAVALQSPAPICVSTDQRPGFDILTFGELLAESVPLSEPDQAYGEDFLCKPDRPKAFKDR